MTITQFSNNGSYSSASNNVLNSRIPVFKDYVQIRSGDNIYSLVIGSYDQETDTFKDATVYTVTSSGSYNSHYEINTANYDSVSVNLSNEYYCYSNVYDGQSYYTQSDLSNTLALSAVGFTLCFAIIISMVFRLIRRR